MSSLDDRIVARGQALFQAIADEKPSLFNKERWTGKVMDWCMRRDGFKVQLFRFVDVYPALTDGDALTRHIQEYFGGDNDAPAVLRWGAGLAGLGGAVGARLLHGGIRRNIEEMAKQFIVGERADDTLRNLIRMRREGFAFTVDVLGEATVSRAEEEQYVRTYVDLLRELAAGQAAWAPLKDAAGREGDLDWGHAPRINVSIKPTALCCRSRPVDFEGTVAAMHAQAARIAEAVRAAGGSLCVDMESYRFKDITLELFRRLRADPRFRDGPPLGIVLQAYLRDTDRDLADLLAWARPRNLPFTVRLVKGAYWDVETVLAKQHGWPVPVWERKPETDLAYERLARVLLQNADLVYFACASHNLRTIASVLEQARELGVPPERYEFQALYGMAEPVRRALLREAGRVRLYAPYGPLVPGMAYLVRRLLENTANESFLRQSFVEAADRARLLENPSATLARELAAAPAPSAPPPAADGLPPFANEPTADFARAEERAAFPRALAEVRRRLGAVVPLHIGGRDVETAERADSVNPAAPDEVVGWISQAGRGETAAAIAAAKKAFPGWRDTPPAERAAFLLKAAAAARRRFHELCAWQVLEIGKQWDQAHGDVGEAVDFLEYYAREILRLGAPQRLGRLPGESNRYLYEPKGLAAIIAPWNFPLAISMGMASAAIAAGCSVVYKPSGITAVIGHHLVELFREAGLPPGVFNFIPGRGSVMGDYLVEHPDISVIGFTGSMETGLRILEKAARVPPGQANVKKVVCEMGGKNAIIVDDDADLDEAIPAVLQSAFGFQGQKCSACSRLIVLDAVYDRFLPRLVEAAEAWTVGPAEHPANDMGPVADAAAQKSILGYIELAKQEGRLRYQSPVPAGAGYYVPLTIVEGIRPEHRLAQEEIFGPVLAVMRAKDFDEALDWANGTRFALTGGLFSRSPERLDRARREFRVGNLYLNRGTTGAMVGRQPFGGARMSGVGTKAGGPDYLLHFMDPRTITENTLRRGFAPAEE